MIEVADIFRQHAASYQARHVLLPSQLRALRDLTHCRTAYFGGHLAQCNHCAHLRYTYHSCRNRHCPKCHGEQTRDWLERQKSRLLPCSYFLLTFTLPADLRRLAWQHQKVVYGALLRAAANTVLTLTADPKWLGATPDIMAVLHTWTRTLLFHPHAHLLVSAGGYRKADQTWAGLKHPAFLVPVHALSRIFRAKMRQALAGAQLLSRVSPEVWDQSWVVHAQPAGAGVKVLEYLARYVFRVAIANSRLEAFTAGHITFRYRENRTQQLRRVTLPADQFIGRFLLHVLPQGFPKVRHYGLGSSSAGQHRQRARNLLAPLGPPPTAPDPVPSSPCSDLPAAQTDPLCPRCRQGHLIPIQLLPPQRGPPP